MRPVNSQSISVAIHGGPGTGKKTLLSALHKTVYVRDHDNAVFFFDAQIGTQSTANPASLAVVLVDATRSYDSEDISETVNLAKQTSLSTCTLFTKVDLFSASDSEFFSHYLYQRWNHPYNHDVDCFAASIISSEGIRQVMDQISNIIAPPRQSLNWKILLQRWYSLGLDLLASFFALPTDRPDTNIDTELSAITSDDDIMRLEEDKMAREWDDDLTRRLGPEAFFGAPAHRISPSLVTKCPAPSERANMEFVRQNTTIPVPRVHHPHLENLVMDYIDGEMLRECWAKQNFFMQFRIACTLRLYIKQLRSLKRSELGRLEDGVVNGVFFADYEYSPFDTIPSFRRFCTCVAYCCWETLKRRGYNDPEPVPRPDFEWSPTFVHGDLNMTNIILDRQDRLWLIDWGYAGFYPPCFESSVMRLSNIPTMLKTVPPSWIRYRGFIAGPTSPEEDNFWDQMRTGIQRFPSHVSY